MANFWKSLNSCNAKICLIQQKFAQLFLCFFFVFLYRLFFLETSLINKFSKWSAKQWLHNIMLDKLGLKKKWWRKWVEKKFFFWVMIMKNKEISEFRNNYNILLLNVEFHFFINYILYGEESLWSIAMRINVILFLLLLINSYRNELTYKIAFRRWVH